MPEQNENTSRIDELAIRLAKVENGNAKPQNMQLLQRSIIQFMTDSGHRRIIEDEASRMIRDRLSSISLEVLADEISSDRMRDIIRQAADRFYHDPNASTEAKEAIRRELRSFFTTSSGTSVIRGGVESYIRENPDGFRTILENAIAYVFDNDSGLRSRIARAIDNNVASAVSARQEQMRAEIARITSAEQKIEQLNTKIADALSRLNTLNQSIAAAEAQSVAAKATLTAAAAAVNSLMASGRLKTP
jgi:polyhydroxyalkanoate synthesis regulator phasin